MPFLALIGLPLIPPWTELRPFVVELWLIAAIIAVLLTPFFVRKPNVATGLVALTGLFLALVSLIVVGADATGANARFGGMLVSDHFAVLWKALLLVFASGIILMWFSTTADTMHEGDGPEFFTLFLGACLGMSLMSSTSNLLMLVMAVELTSLPSYVLAGFRKTDRIGSEASLKYVLFGAATSSIMIYGISMLYGIYGSLQVDQLAASVLATFQANPTPGAYIPLVLALAGIIIGVGFKISAVPLHFWCPDVFQGASIDVSAFLSVASKGAGLTLLLRVLMSLAHGLNYQGEALVATAAVVGVIGAVTATVGNSAALWQENIKRMLAYSSIAHAGYMLCALSMLVRAPGANAPGGPENAAHAILLYLAVYMFMNLGAFTVAGLVARAPGGGENVADFADLGRRNPVLAAAMAIFMLSLVGLPPFAGFFAKLNVMIVLGNASGWWWVLVAVIGVNTVVSLYYYVRVLRAMYLSSGREGARETATVPLDAHPLGSALAVACALMLLVMFFFFEPLSGLARRYARLSLDRPTAPAAVAPNSAVAPGVAPAGGGRVTIAAPGE